MKRTFFAVKISDQSRQLMRQIKADIPEIETNVRVANPKNAHVTLKFLGNIAEELIPEIEETLTPALQNFHCFEYHCQGTGVFPRPSRPSVLWLGIQDPTHSLHQLYEIISERLVLLGIPEDRRRFKPHLTFGRVKNKRHPVKGLTEFLDYDYTPVKNEVAALIFYESQLHPRGAIHRPLKIFKLTKP